MALRKKYTEFSFNVLLNGKVIKTFTDKDSGEMMKRVWKKFNAFAKTRKCKCDRYITDKKYLGLTAWTNESGDIVELVKA